MVVVPSGYQHGGATALHVRVGSSAGALVSRPRWSRQRGDHGGRGDAAACVELGATRDLGNE